MHMFNCIYRKLVIESIGQVYRVGGGVSSPLVNFAEDLPPSLTFFLFAPEH